MLITPELGVNFRFYELRNLVTTNYAVYYALHIVVAEATIYHYQVAIFKMFWIYAARFDWVAVYKGLFWKERIFARFEYYSGVLWVEVWVILVVEIKPLIYLGSSIYQNEGFVFIWIVIEHYEYMISTAWKWLVTSHPKQRTLV